MCGADFVERCGGWHKPRGKKSARIVVSRPGTELVGSPAKGWVLARGSAGDCSSTRIRGHIQGGRWRELAESVDMPQAVVDFLKQRHEEGCLFFALNQRATEE